MVALFLWPFLSGSKARGRILAAAKLARLAAKQKARLLSGHEGAQAGYPFWKPSLSVFAWPWPGGRRFLKRNCSHGIGERKGDCQGKDALSNPLGCLKYEISPFIVLFTL
jgi:hypothetical protein